MKQALALAISIVFLCGADLSLAQSKAKDAGAAKKQAQTAASKAMRDNRQDMDALREHRDAAGDDLDTRDHERRAVKEKMTREEKIERKRLKAEAKAARKLESGNAKLHRDDSDRDRGERDHDRDDKDNDRGRNERDHERDDFEPHDSGSAGSERAQEMRQRRDERKQIKDAYRADRVPGQEASDRAGNRTANAAGDDALQSADADAAAKNAKKPWWKFWQ